MVLYSSFWALVLALALIHNGATHSPLPEYQNELESFNEVVNNASFRLPTTTVPTHYEVSITPYFENVPIGRTPFTFDGEVTIYINVTENDVNEIVMHCNDLTISGVTLTSEIDNNLVLISDTQPECDPDYSFLRINPSVPIQLGETYIVRMSFVGNLQTNMRGFYRSWYYDSSGLKRWMGTTQFQPGHARQAFPCYDEPSFKATFDFTINREEDFSDTLFNMPIKDRVTVNGRVSESFYTTPKMSTYLLAFIVSHYIVVSPSTDPERPFDIYARDNVGTTGDWSRDVGEQLLVAMEEYTDFPYYTIQANMSLKQAAIPDFSAGAMENWGLLTYRESLILYDPLNSNHFYKQRSANIVSHEIAHLWFGNLVTCAWWENLWLNEGFARFYQYYLTGSVLPELGYEIRFIVEQLHTSMFSDSIDTAHALTNRQVNDPASVSDNFSTITYARGASILRMTQHLLGNDTYVKGLRLYLEQRQFDVAEPHHLFSALDEVAENDEALSRYRGVTVADYLRSWSEKAGHPLLTVVTNQHTGQMFVTQERWERNTGRSQLSGLWHVPVTWTRAGDADFDNLKPSNVLTAQVTVLQRGTEGLEWVLFNIQQTGFYRVNYDDDNWGLLTLALRSNQSQVIHEINRAQIVDDLFALARAGVRTYTKALNVISFLEFDDDYAPWMAAISGFNFLRRRLAHESESLQNLHELIRQLSTTVTARLGYSEVPEDTYMDGLFRMYLNSFLCSIGHSDCVTAAVEHFRSFRQDGTPIPPNMRPWVYCTGLREGNAGDFDALLERYLLEDLSNEKLVLLEALGCTRDPDSLAKYLDQIIADNDSVRPQDFNLALSSAVTGNEGNAQLTFVWLNENLNRTNEILGSLATLVSYISARLITNEDILEFETWLGDNEDAIGGTAYRTGISGVASARANLQWTDARLPELAEYFNNGYQDVVVELPATTEPPTPTPGPTIGTTPRAAANIFHLGITTLFMTLFVNILF